MRHGRQPARAWRRLCGLVVLLGCGCGLPDSAVAARITSLSPQGEVPQARQVVARFDAPVVRFGDPRLPDPLRLRCEGASAAGSGRGTGAQEWVYDLREALPSGARCTVDADPAWMPLTGTLEGPRVFRFSTGGPAIVGSWPHPGAAIEKGQTSSCA